MTSRRDERLWRGALGVLVAVAALAVFSPALRNGFVTFDDFLYIRDERGIQALGLANLRWMLTAVVGGLWQPLTLLSLALDYRLWNLDPWGYHATNIALHAACGVQFYRVCAILYRRALPSREPSRVASASAAAALFFVLHPLRVESVAWAVERKDVLSGVLLLTAVLWRLRASEVNQPRRVLWEGAALAAYALSLSAKIVGVTLPVVLAILEVFPLRRLSSDPRRWFERPARRVWLSLLPYAVVAAAGAFASITKAQASGMMSDFGGQGALWRGGQALYALLFYPAKTLWPYSLAAYYGPKPWFGRWSWQLLGCATGVAASALAIARVGRRRPALAAVFACYAVLLAPMSGLVQNGMLYSASDRFSYIPCLGFAMLFGAAFMDAGRAGRALAVAWLIGLGALSARQCAVWRDTLTLWETTATRAPSGFAQSNYGVALVEAGRVDEGIRCLEATTTAYPDFGFGYDNLGVVLNKRGQRQRALELWREGLTHDPIPELHAHLSEVLAREGAPAARREALTHAEAVVARRPRGALWRLTLADELAHAGRADEAQAQYAAALDLDSGLGRAHNNLALLLAARGRLPEAEAHYRRALETPEARAEANYNFGNLRLAQGRPDEAARHYLEALRLNPGLAQAQVNLGNILARRGRFDEAAARYRAALKKDPGSFEARANLAAVRRLLSR